jgi:hypothetical protein
MRLIAIKSYSNEKVKPALSTNLLMIDSPMATAGVSTPDESLRSSCAKQMAHSAKILEVEP